jgi:hypothetical protein
MLLLCRLDSVQRKESPRAALHAHSACPGT